MNMETKNVVLVGTNKDIYLSYQNPKYGEKLKDVSIVPIEKVADDKRFSVRPAKGQIFIRVPDIDRYILNDDNIELNIQKAHINVFFELCRKLGAVKCYYKLSIEEHSHSFLTNIFKGNIPKGQGNVSVESEEEQNLRKKLKVSYDFARMDDSFILTEAEWEGAKKFLNDSDYLSRDDDCVALLNGRKPSERTQVQKKEVSLTISQDISTDTKVAAELATLGEVVKVNNDLAVKRKSNKTVTAHFTVAFKN